MPDPHGAVEPRLQALERVLETMTGCIRELDRLGLPICAARLEHACDVVRDELSRQIG